MVIEMSTEMSEIEMTATDECCMMGVFCPEMLYFDDHFLFTSETGGDELFPKYL